MIIKELNLKKFRNYEKLNINFGEKINILVGNNAQGKTNILESIYVLAITKSHRTHLDSNLMKENNKYCKINGIIKKDEQLDDSELEVLINFKGKKVSIDKNPIKKISDYISYFNVIVFHPGDLDIIKGAPSDRRRFLNIEIGQLDNKYFYVLNGYNAILKNRNEYLKRITIDKYDKSYLDIITNQLVDYAIKLYNYRDKYIKDINKSIAKINKKIKGFDKLEIKYEPAIPLEESVDMRETLIAKYKACLPRDIVMTQTTIGPHRDDFVFWANDKRIKEYGSQGQQRIAILCLKFAEIELIKKEKGEYPILLLDDIFSELDSNKCQSIINYLNKRMQIIITTTDISMVENNILKNASIFLVNNAEVQKIDNTI
ncbi:MAG: DNA replication/repair protein RecF [Bacilli bacterium]|nr:DNA replication/repair protein RecF [Bacilli bacterium]